MSLTTCRVEGLNRRDGRSNGERLGERGDTGLPRQICGLLSKELKFSSNLPRDHRNSISVLSLFSFF